MIKNTPINELDISKDVIKKSANALKTFYLQNNMAPDGKYLQTLLKND